MSVVDFRSKLYEVFNHEDIKEDRDFWQNVVERTCAFGPRRVGPSIFIDSTGANTCKRFLMESYESKDARIEKIESSTSIAGFPTLLPTHSSLQRAKDHFVESLRKAWQCSSNRSPLANLVNSMIPAN